MHSHAIEWPKKRVIIHIVVEFYVIEFRISTFFGILGGAEKYNLIALRAFFVL